MEGRQSIPADVLDFLEQRGVAARLAMARRAEVETRREEILREIETMRTESSASVQPALERLRKAEANLSAAQDSLEHAKNEVNLSRSALASVDRSFSIERRLGELARLADPMIRLAAAHLRGCIDAVRTNGLVQWTSSEKAWDHVRLVRNDFSNADTVNQLLEELRSALVATEALLVAPCPGDLLSTILRIVEDAEGKCLAIGVRTERPREFVERLELVGVKNG